MGLFSNNKKPCPICGNATPRLLPTKVEGVPICKECDKKIDLPNGVLDSMTLDDFRRYFLLLFPDVLKGLLQLRFSLRQIGLLVLKLRQ